MKKIAASVGLVALGTSMIHGVETGALNSYQNNKAWSVSASLRGFYDDNINTAKSDKTDSIGYEVNPSINYGMAGEMTALNFTYSFSGKYYDKKRSANDTDKWDLTHIIGADLSHSFSQRTSLFLRDSFVVGQEPDVLRSGNAIVGNQTISGSNIRNYASAKLNTKVTELLGFEIGYNNTFFNYADEGAGVSAGQVISSHSGLLDRMEHAANLESRWTLSEQTTAILGYRFGFTDFTGNEPILGPVGSPVVSSDRNARRHTIYGGAEHVFTPDISGSLRVGATYSDLYNDPASDKNWDPYVSASLHYQFLPESSVDVGLSVDQNASDFAGSGTAFVRDIQTIVGYGKISHRILAQLYGSGSLTYQHQVYNGGGTGVDGEAADYLILGLNLDYRFNRNLSTSLGYNFDNVNSNVAGGTDYNRNRIYFGVTATY